ncbi:hypothetical protein C823_005262 [Eubacterium plexicaudatum ASF492]|nr:hypothetical protein C823_005262 [Eubacterium plexicaudatum ASF492]
MVVDITPSLAAGEIEQKMYENICSHYSIGQKDVETVLEKIIQSIVVSTDRIRMF